MQCTACTPQQTGEEIRVRFVGEKTDTILKVAVYSQCPNEALSEEVIDTVNVAGKLSDLTAFHCQIHQIKAPK